MNINRIPHPIPKLSPITTSIGPCTNCCIRLAPAMPPPELVDVAREPMLLSNSTEHHQASYNSKLHITRKRKQIKENIKYMCERKL
jgi:hypothetical protein